MTETTRPAAQRASSAFRLGLYHPTGQPETRRAVFAPSSSAPCRPAMRRSGFMPRLLAVVFLNETIWNTLVARIFSFDRTKARLYQPEIHH